MNLKALHNLSYGLYVISSRKGDRFNGQIANTIVQVTSEPPTISVCINKQNLTHEFIAQSKVFHRFYTIPGYATLFHRSLWLQVGSGNRQIQRCQLQTR